MSSSISPMLLWSTEESSENDLRRPELTIQDVGVRYGGRGV